MHKIFRGEGPCPAKIMVVGDFPSVGDEAKSRPLTGFPGEELASMLSDAGLSRNNCFVTTALRVRPPGNAGEAFFAMTKAAVTAEHIFIRDKMCLKPVWEGLEELKREITMVKPNVIIALGNVSLWMLTGKWGITSWRGSLLTSDLVPELELKVVPTCGPGMVMQQYSRRPVTVADLRRVKRYAETRGVKHPEYEFIIRPDYQRAKTTLEQLLALVGQGPLTLSVDIETRAGHIACIGIAWSTLAALCIPLMCVERPEGYWPEEVEVELMWLMYQLLTHPNAKVIGQNFLYDAQYFFRWLHYVPNLTRDTMLAQHTCFSSMEKSLAFQASMYCEQYVYWKDEGKEWNADIPEDRLWWYNCLDAVHTFEVDEVEQRNVDAMGLRSVHDFQQELFWPVLDTMLLGILPNISKRAQFAQTLHEAIESRDKWLTDVLGEPLNIRSSPQMKSLFYDQLNFKPIKDRKTGETTCNEEALHKIADREPLIQPLINKILELRSLNVFLSTFVNAPLDKDNRIRCSFNIAGTETYRFSSSKNAFGTGLNLQNIPSGGLDLPNIRELFLPDQGKTFFDIDLASADFRIVTWEADEPELKAMFREGLDPYTEIAKEFYGDQSIGKKDPRRQTFKAFAHGTNYLGTAKGLAERLGLSIQDAERTQAWYFKRFPKIKAWQEEVKTQVVKRRMVQNVFGYRTYFFDRIEGTIFNQAVAWIPQSTVACLINRAYMNIYKQLREVEVLLQVHDSLAGQYPTHKEEELLPKILECARIALPYPGDPLTIPVGIKKSTQSWGHCA